MNHVLVQQYRHMGEGIDYGEVERFRKVLTEIILSVYNQTPRRNDSPVYTFLNQLTPPTLAAAMRGAAEAAARSAPAADERSHEEKKPENAKLYSELIEEAEEAKKAKNFEEAKSLLKLLRKKMKPSMPEEAGLPEPPENRTSFNSSRSSRTRPSTIRWRKRSPRSEKRAICSTS